MTRSDETWVPVGAWLAARTWLERFLLDAVSNELPGVAVHVNATPAPNTRDFAVTATLDGRSMPPLIVAWMLVEDARATAGGPIQTLDARARDEQRLADRDASRRTIEGGVRARLRELADQPTPRRSR